MRQENKQFDRKKRWVLALALVFFAFQLVLPALVVPREAQAQFGLPNFSITLGDIPRQIWETIKTTVQKAYDVLYKNVLRNYLNALAYNTAVKIATGAPGQKPLFPTSLETLGKQALDTAAGDFLDGLAQSWSEGTCQSFPDQKCFKDSECPATMLMCPDAAQEIYTVPQYTDQTLNLQALGCAVIPNASDDTIDKIADEISEGQREPYTYFDEGSPKCIKDFSLCEPKDITAKVKLQIMARQAVFGAPAAITTRCPLSEIIDNVEATQSQRLIELSKTFNPEATEFGIFLDLQETAKITGMKAEESAMFEKIVEGAFSSVTKPISGAITTPAPLVEDMLKQVVGAGIAQTFVRTGTPAADAIGTFTNTLASKLIERILKKGISLGGGGGGRGTAGFLGGLFGGSSPGISAAKLVFADLQQTTFTESGELDILGKLSSCPDSKDPTPDTCVIDSRFATAIEQRLTVREALDKGLLDGTRTFGFDSNGREPEYYNGYPYRSLVILRKYRVIPVGWELAAQYMQQYERGNYSLNRLIADYNDDASPFYHLIDPNWVLKVPDLYCKRQGAGPKVISQEVVAQAGFDNTNFSSEIIQRQNDYCADEQTCLKENEDGSCKKYGYCVEEKPIWKFNGTGCESYYNSCQTLEQRGGIQVSYLKNTLDYDNCTADNAGCQWYCQDWDNANGQWTCTNEEPPAGGDKISFNKNAEECSASAEGCHEFKRVAGNGTNLLVNSDFEQFTGTKDDTDPDDFLRWSGGGAAPCGDRLLAVSGAFDGFTSGQIRSYADCPGDPAHYTTQSVDTGYLTDGRSFNVSFYAKRDSNDADCDMANADVGKVQFQLGRVIDTVANPDVGDYTDGPILTLNDQWTRYTGTLTFGSVPTANWQGANADEVAQLQRTMTLFVRRPEPTTDACDVVVDNIQLEEGNLSSYKTYEDSANTYLRKAPDYLTCTGNPATDDPGCSDYALACSASEVGCQAYTSTTSGQEVAGIITSPTACDPNNPASCDQCPAEFVGCRAFRELPIERVPRRPARDPVSFVPSTGDSCPASAVGCEEYTNLEEVAQGGEGKEYYSWIKQCVNADDAAALNYYTWEGSDEFGYQLKSYRLKKSNLDDGPCTNVAAEDPFLAGLGLSWPACIDGAQVDRDGDGTFEEVYSPAFGAGVCDQAIYSAHTNPDCTEFYDDSGSTFYRLRTRIIYASAECKSYRNSIDGPDVTYHMIPGQGFSCSAAYAGCRAYKGNAGDNTRQVYFSDFEQGTVVPWVGSVTYSNESVNVGGHSMLVANSGAIASVGTTLGFQKDRQYTIAFWAKGTVAQTPISVALNTAPPLSFQGQAVASVGEWNRFELGPLYIPDDPAIDLDTTQLQLFADNAFYIDNIVITEVFENIYLIKDSYTECSGYENCDQYTDRAGGAHYLKSFSRLCGEDKVGCEALIDTQNSASPFSSTYTLAISDRLRGDMVLNNAVDVADRAFLNAYLNTGGLAPSPLETGDVNFDGVVNQADLDYLDAYLAIPPTGPAPQPANIYERGTIPADTVVTLVNDPAKSCASTSKGCQKLGRPSLDAVGAISSFATAYLKNDPGKYGSTLCLFENSSCEEYATPGGSELYFKNPGTKTCEYKRVTGQDTAGWYQTGTDQGVPDCPIATGICLGGVNNGEPANELADCPGGTFEPRGSLVPHPEDNWVGVCNAVASGCTEYRDPEEPTACDIALPDGGGDGVETNPQECNSYYYLSDTVDKGSCNGLVSREEGCRLFDDTSTSELPYDAQASQNGQTPALCSGGVGCDSNTVAKVIKDRECNRWLECENSWPRTDQDGNVENLCTALMLCDKMDEQTGNCLNQPGYSQANQTYATPVFVDRIKNYSGMVLAGLNWGRRCDNAPQTICVSDADCTNDGHCKPFVVEGSLPYPAMEEVGAISIEGDLIRYGDFGDSTAERNKILSEDLSEVDNSSPPRAVSGDEPLSDLLGDCSPTLIGECWGPRNWSNAPAGARWTEEKANGQIPSDNPNLDENNVAMVTAGSQWAGVFYNLGKRVSAGQEYVVSFRFKLGTPASSGDKFIAQLEYVREGDEFNNGFLHDFGRTDTGYQDFGEFFPDETATDSWQLYTLGPMTANEIGASDAVHFNVIYYNVLGNPHQIVFYLDDVSMKPVLKVQENRYCTSGEAVGLRCQSDGDCPGSTCNLSQPTTLARSCRLYPKDNAPYCTYTDTSNTTYQGWSGYCLERDPIHPKYCLNWWPIDLLSGESDVFSTLSPEGYVGRRPLYYCGRAEGNYEVYYTNDLSGTTLTSTNYQLEPGGMTVRAYGGTEACCDTDDCGGDHDCSGEDIKTCDWTCGGMNHWYIRDNSTNMREDNIERITLTMANSGGGQNWEFGWPVFNKSTTFGGSTCSPNNCSTQEHRLERLSHIDVDGTFYNIWSMYPTSCVDSGSGDNNRACLWMQFLFEEDSKELRELRLGGEDTEGDDEGALMYLNIVLREPCQYLVQVASSSEATAWNQRVRSGSTDPVDGLLYRYSEDFMPFGGVVNPEGNSPEDWDNGGDYGLPTFVEARQDTQPPLNPNDPGSNARARWPYSCEGNCSARRCSNATNDCSSIALINACLQGSDPDNPADDGYCIGVGELSTDEDNIYNDGGGGSVDLTLDQAKQRIQRLFADVIDVWFFNYDQPGISQQAGRYDRTYPLAQALLTSFHSNYNTMGLCPGTPPVRPLNDFAGEYCGVPVKVVTTVGGQPAGATYIALPNGGNLQFVFNITADQQQEPVRLIEVDWDGDNIEDFATAGRYDSGSFVLDHEFTQVRQYSPRIRVVDNWEWCSAPPRDSRCTNNFDCRYNDYNDEGASGNPGCDWAPTDITVCVGTGC